MMSSLQQHSKPLFPRTIDRLSSPQPDLDGWSPPTQTVDAVDQQPTSSQPPNSNLRPWTSVPETMLKVESPPTPIRDLRNDSRLSSTSHIPTGLGTPRRSPRSRENHHDSIDAAEAAQTMAPPPRKRHYNRKTKGVSEQERLDLKREKNRIAASKCRDKKMIWEKNLEEHARRLQDNNMQLSMMLTSMAQEHLNLKELIVRHSINSPNCRRVLLDSVDLDLSLVSQTRQGDFVFPPSEKAVHGVWEDAMVMKDVPSDDVVELDEFFESLNSQDD